MPLKAIIFDKDGTLFDLGAIWNQPSVEVAHELLDQAGISGDEKAAYLDQFGIVRDEILPNTLFSSESIQDQAAVFAPIVNRPAEELAAWIEGHYLSYVENHPEMVVPMPGSQALVKELANDYRLGIVTNDNHDITVKMLEIGGMLAYFDFIGAADTYPQKPQVDVLEAIGQEFACGLDEMIYVGDSSVDMEFGQLTRAAVGLAVEDSLREIVKDADYIMTHLDQLRGIIRQIEA